MQKEGIRSLCEYTQEFFFHTNATTVQVVLVVVLVVVENKRENLFPVLTLGNGYSFH